MSASSQTVARRQDITLADPLEQLQEEDEYADKGNIRRILFSISLLCLVSL
jgi:hypothetical protein